MASAGVQSSGVRSIWELLSDVLVFLAAPAGAGTEASRFFSGLSVLTNAAAAPSCRARGTRAVRHMRALRAGHTCAARVRVSARVRMRTPGWRRQVAAACHGTGRSQARFVPQAAHVRACRDSRCSAQPGMLCATRLTGAPRLRSACSCACACARVAGRAVMGVTAACTRTGCSQAASACRSCW